MVLELEKARFDGDLEAVYYPLQIESILNEPPEVAAPWSLCDFCINSKIMCSFPDRAPEKNVIEV